MGCECSSADPMRDEYERYFENRCVDTDNCSDAVLP